MNTIYWTQFIVLNVGLLHASFRNLFICWQFTLNRKSSGEKKPLNFFWESYTAQVVVMVTEVNDLQTGVILSYRIFKKGGTFVRRKKMGSFFKWCFMTIHANWKYRAPIYPPPLDPPTTFGLADADLAGAWFNLISDRLVFTRDKHLCLFCA